MFLSAAFTLRCHSTGKERDAETGLDFFLARYFSGAQGRFSSPDEALLYADPDNPQSWNLYAYGLNSPLVYIDPDGHKEIDPCAGDPDHCIVVTAAAPPDPTAVEQARFDSEMAQKHPLLLGDATLITAIRPGESGSKKNVCAQEAWIGLFSSFVPLGTPLYDAHYNGVGFSGLLGSNITKGVLMDVGKDAAKNGIENSGPTIKRITGLSKGTVSDIVGVMGKGMWLLEIGLGIEEARERYKKCME